MSSQSCYPNKAPVVDSVLETLSNSIRREVVNYFEGCVDNEAAQLNEITAHINNRIPSKDRSRLEYELHHKHLPKLAERDWVEYDTRHRNIRYYGNDRASNLLDDVSAIF